MIHILHTSIAHKTVSLADEGNYAYCQSRGAHTIKHKLWKIALTSTLMSKRGIELGNDAVTVPPQLHVHR